MSEINFFTPVQFNIDTKCKTYSDSLLEKVDGYFYLGQKVAHVTPESLHRDVQDVILAEHKTSWAVTALKVVSYFTVILPALLLIAKAFLRSAYEFQGIDGTVYAEHILGEGLDIPRGEKLEIEDLMSVLVHRKDHQDIIWLSKGPPHLMFQLRKFPKFIFKMALENIGRLQYQDRTGQWRYLQGHDHTEEEFDNIVEAKKVCFTHQLNEIEIPSTRKFSVTYDDKEFPVMAQEFIPTKTTLAESSHGLEKSVRQMTRLIAETGLHRTQPHNFRVNNGHIIRLDFRKTEKPADALFDSFHGFIKNLSSEEHIDAMLSEAARYGVKHGGIHPKAAKEWRMAELERAKALHNYYKANGVLLAPLKTIEVHFGSLDFNLEEVGKVTTQFDQDGNPVKTEPITLREVLFQVIDAINEGIGTQEGQEETVSGHRQVIIGRGDLSRCTFPSYTPSSWLDAILNAFKEQGAIFDWYRGTGYIVQA